MPSFPKLTRIDSLIRRIEVDRQIKTHKHCHTCGYIRITREVGIYLQRITKKSHQVLEPREHSRIFEYPIHKIHSQIIRQYYLFYQSVEYPEDSYTELFLGKEVRFVYLRDKFVGTYDRSRHQRGEKADEKAIIEQRTYRLHLTSINLYDIAYVLEGEKRNTHRQYYLTHIETRIARNHVANLGKNVDYLQLNAEQTVYHVYYEVRIFEVTQQQYVYDQSDYQPYLTAPFGTGYGYCFGTKIIE